MFCLFYNKIKPKKNTSPKKFIKNSAMSSKPNHHRRYNPYNPRIKLADNVRDQLFLRTPQARQNHKKHQTEYNAKPAATRGVVSDTFDGLVNIIHGAPKKENTILTHNLSDYKKKITRAIHNLNESVTNILIATTANNNVKATNEVTLKVSNITLNPGASMDISQSLATNNSTTATQTLSDDTLTKNIAEMKDIFEDIIKANMKIVSNSKSDVFEDGTMLTATQAKSTNVKNTTIQNNSTLQSLDTIFNNITKIINKKLVDAKLMIANNTHQMQSSTIQAESLIVEDGASLRISQKNLQISEIVTNMNLRQEIVNTILASYDSAAKSVLEVLQDVDLLEANTYASKIEGFGDIIGSFTMPFVIGFFVFAAAILFIFYIKKKIVFGAAKGVLGTK